MSRDAAMMKDLIQVRSLKLVILPIIFDLCLHKFGL